MPRLEKWSVAGRPKNAYQAPELWTPVIYGFIYDDEKGRFHNGDYIHTSSIKELNIKEMTLQTRNTLYELGEPDPRFMEYLKTNGYKLEDYHKVENKETTQIDIGDLKIEKHEVFEMDYSTFETLVKRVYNIKEYEYVADIEYGNDSCGTYNVTPKIDKYDEKKLKKFTEEGKYSFTAHVLLDDMCRRGIIEKGEYLINVCW